MKSWRPSGSPARLVRRMAVATVAVAAGMSGPCMAQTPYPARPIRIVVPYPPGGGNDIVGRFIAEDLAQRLGRVRPGQLTFSSAGSGTGTHLSGEQFKVLGRVDLLHVPYRGGNSAITAVIGGEATTTFGSFSAVSPFVPSGRLRLIGVTSAKRSSIAPQVPTVAESGLPGYEMTPWYALLAPRGVPQAVIDRLAVEVAASLQSVGMRERLAQVGYEPEGGGPERLAGRIREETARYGRLTKAIGFREE